MIELLVPQHDFTKEEPQQFGMVSFTESAPNDSARIRKRFGNYGVVISQRWAEHNNARKVSYIPCRGREFEQLKSRFQSAYEKAAASIPYPDDGMWKLVFTNRFFSIGGAAEWTSLLGQYDYMEPASNGYQREWRIVQDKPLHGYPATTKEIVASISPAMNWSFLFALTLPSNEVVGLVCPHRDEAVLKRQLVFPSVLPICLV